MSTILSPQAPPSTAPAEVLPSGNLPTPILNRRMTNRGRRLIATIQHAILHHGLAALLLPLGLLFLALVVHG
jgi:hypothetical protein